MRWKRGWLPWSAWVMLPAALLSAIAGSPVYVWGVYNDELGNILFPGDAEVHQKLQFLALGMNIAGTLPFAGIFYDTRFGGPSNTMVVGAVFSFTGFFLLSRMAAGWDLSIGGSNLPVALIMLSFGGHASSYIASAVIPPAGHGFPDHRGQVMGIVKAFFGLGATVLLAFYYAFFEDDGDADVGGFLLFMSIACPAQAVVIGVFLSEPPPVPATDTSMMWRFGYASAVTVSIAVVQLAVAVYRATVGALGAAASGAVLGATILQCALLTLIPYRSGPLRTARPRSPPPPTAGGRGSQQEGSNLLPPPANGGEGAAVAATATGIPPSQACRTLTFWALYFSCFAGFGSNWVASNNVQQIFRAKGASPADPDAAKVDSDVAVQLGVIFSCAGRMGGGFFSDRLLRFGVSRWLFFAGLLLLHALSNVALAVPASAAGGSVALVYAGVALISFGYGACMVLMVVMQSEMYGLAYVASNVGWCATSIAAASLLLNTGMAAEVFRLHHTRDADGTMRCYGTACFAATHYVLVGLCAAGVVTCLWMHRRGRRRDVGYEPSPVPTDVPMETVAPTAGAAGIKP